ncbi:uncharacterized protein PHACADRAFT_167361 [Phanerochaete carnosa HHB-10118-sp]|uniref:Uncharacterized protein n=1 Tax=Phanerochaete carnosa (strain HHB-10118-sp) TaxID=650164 RepID=K5VCZ8_PHACS|nr:uncharacterized protein PHACADRAFT_167361 [Phanerochaete carnosa HHB-10118-sp]EKM48988.1 hypothetical protein PHACADRAFT_167361 [Phanerochaete carnosa HHB-10118-sp]
MTRTTLSPIHGACNSIIFGTGDHPPFRRPICFATRSNTMCSSSYAVYIGSGRGCFAFRLSYSYPSTPSTQVMDDLPLNIRSAVVSTGGHATDPQNFELVSKIAV